jgi:hypothetical protein
MTVLDHYTISRHLGSNFREYTRRGFGLSNVSASTAQYLKSLPSSNVVLTRDSTTDPIIVSAYSQVHAGYSLDRFLSDPLLVSEFIALCRKEGINAPASAINRRLFRFRKDKTLEPRLPPTTREDARDVTPWLVAAELAFVRLNYERDISTDDILADPVLGGRFDDLAGAVTPGGEPVDYRQAALHLRKNLRTRKDLESRALVGFNTSVLSQQWREAGTLADISNGNDWDEDLVFRVYEPSRSFFIGRNGATRKGFEAFQSGRALEAWTNRFWRPDASSIRVATISPRPTLPALSLIELKAIQTYEPIFNMRLSA